MPACADIRPCREPKPSAPWTATTDQEMWFSAFGLDFFPADVASPHSVGPSSKNPLGKRPFDHAFDHVEDAPGGN